MATIPLTVKPLDIPFEVDIIMPIDGVGKPIRVPLMQLPLSTVEQLLEELSNAVLDVWQKAQVQQKAQK